MKLYYPGTELEFSPSISYFIGDLDIYDREETLGKYLEEFDPNNRSDVYRVMKEMFFYGARVSALSAAHKALLIQVLINALKDPLCDFGRYFEAIDDNGDAFTLPFGWEIKNPRLFFEEVYRIAMEEWHEDIIDMPSLHDLEIP